MAIGLVRLGNLLVTASVVVLLVLWAVFGTEGMRDFEWGQVLWAVFGAPLLIIGGTLRAAETKENLRMRPFFKILFVVVLVGWLFVTVMFVGIKQFGR